MNLNAIRSRWMWPGVILVSAAATSLFFFQGIASPFRLMTTLWFLLVCPGMAFVRLLRLDASRDEWTLAIAMSIAADAIVASLLVYTRIWSMELGLSILIVLSLLGAFLQVRGTRRQPVKSRQEVYPSPQETRPQPAQSQEEVHPGPQETGPQPVQSQQEVSPSPQETRPQPAQSQEEVHSGPQRNTAEGSKCPRCHAEQRQRRAGFTRSGSQRYRCGRCGKGYTLKTSGHIAQTQTVAGHQGLELPQIGGSDELHSFATLQEPGQQRSMPESPEEDVSK